MDAPCGDNGTPQAAQSGSTGMGEGQAARPRSASAPASNGPGPKLCWPRAVPEGSCAGPENVKGHLPRGKAALRMVSGRKCRPRCLYRLSQKISDNASRCGLPTSVLNHETSDHLLSPVETLCPAWARRECESGESQIQVLKLFLFGANQQVCAFETAHPLDVVVEWREWLWRARFRRTPLNPPPSGGGGSAQR